jgi:DNA-binding transcriptional ArsR family regulator
MAYDSALAALADPTRREVFERLRSGPRAVGEIAEEMPVSRPAVSQHLKVLKEAGLVADRAEGARRVYYIDPHGLGPLRKWLDQFWDQALVAFQAEIERSRPAPETQSREKNDESHHHARARPQKRSRQRSSRTRF